MSKPLSKDALWQIYVSKNPHWLTDGAKMTPDGIKRFFDQTFELGQANGAEAANKVGEKLKNIFSQYRKS